MTGELDQNLGQIEQININFPRLEKALKDYTRMEILKIRNLKMGELGELERIELNKEFFEKSKQIVEILRGIYKISGHFTQSESMLRKIGETIIASLERGQKIKVFVPTCPDYKHDGNKYCFGKLGGNIPLLAQKHFEYIQRLKMVLGEYSKKISIVFLVADQEALDKGIRENVSETVDSFLEKVDSTILIMEDRYKDEISTVSRMTTYFPELLEMEQREILIILNDEKVMERIAEDAKTRMPMYKQIYPNIDFESAIKRTIKVAAQYLAISKIIKNRNALFINHSTTNLFFARDVNVALLHNSQDVY